MNGAHGLIETLLLAGVDVCFANPGTSEMHFVAAAGDIPQMRVVPALFEGVATGAADGYARVARQPAATLTHLGPGLANGMANLHNARRARSPVVNVVGDHAVYHKHHDSPLNSDIETIARGVSKWVERPLRSEDVTLAGALAVATASSAPQGVATLVLPADVSWGQGAVPHAPLAPYGRSVVSDEVVSEVAKMLTSGDSCALLLGGDAGSPSSAGRCPADRSLHRSARPAGDGDGPPESRRRSAELSEAQLPSGVGPTPARRRRAPHPGRRCLPGDLLRVSRGGQQPGAVGMPGPRAVRARRRCRRGPRPSRRPARRRLTAAPAPIRPRPAVRPPRPLSPRPSSGR